MIQQSAHKKMYVPVKYQIKNLQIKVKCQKSWKWEYDHYKYFQINLEQTNHSTANVSCFRK